MSTYQQATIDQIKLNFKYQLRECNNSAHVNTLAADFEERIEAGEHPLKTAIDVAELEGELFVVDGFHRYTALLKCEYKGTFPIRVVATDPDVAFHAAANANSQHEGLTRTGGDKLKAAKASAEFLLENGKECNHYYWKLPAEKVAKFCSVSKATGERAVKEINAKLTEERDAKILELHEEGMSQRAIADEIGVAQSTISKAITESDRKSAMRKIDQQESVQQNSNTIPTSTPEEQAALLKPKGEKEAHSGYEDRFNKQPDEMFADEGHPESHVFKREKASALGGGYATRILTATREQEKDTVEGFIVETMAKAFNELRLEKPEIEIFSVLKILIEELKSNTLEAA